MTATVDALDSEHRTAPSTFSYTVQRMCIWSSVVCLLGVFVGLVIAGWLPAPAPNRSMAEVQQDFVDHKERIRIGCLLMLLTAPLWLSWCTAVSLQMRRIEGRLGPLSLLQLAFGWVGVAPFMAPPLLWLVAAYRPETQSPEVTQILLDLGWLGFVATPILAMFQQLAIAAAILTDCHDEPILPRWLGYGAIWVTIIFIPGSIAYFFYHGLFAWNGLLVFWLPAVAFGLWWIPAIKCLLDALNREEAEAAR